MSSWHLCWARIAIFSSCLHACLGWLSRRLAVAACKGICWLLCPRVMFRPQLMLQWYFDAADAASDSKESRNEATTVLWTYGENECFKEMKGGEGALQECQASWHCFVLVREHLANEKRV